MTPDKQLLDLFDECCKQGRDDYQKPKLTNYECIGLTGRSLNVLSKMLGGISKDNVRAKSFTQKGALVGKLLVGVARILTPDSVEGALFENGMSVLVLLDILLMVLAIVRPEFQTPAIVLVGWTLGIGVFVMLADNITGIQVPAVRWWKIILSTLVAAIATGLALWVRERSITTKPDQSLEHVGFLVYVSAAFTAGLLIVAGYIWTQIAKKKSQRSKANAVSEILAVAVVGVLVVMCYMGAPFAVQRLGYQDSWRTSIGAALAILAVTVLADLRMHWGQVKVQTEGRFGGRFGPNYYLSKGRRKGAILALEEYADQILAKSDEKGWGLIPQWRKGFLAFKRKRFLWLIRGKKECLRIAWDKDKSLLWIGFSMPKPDADLIALPSKYDKYEGRLAVFKLWPASAPLEDYFPIIEKTL